MTRICTSRFVGDVPATATPGDVRRGFALPAALFGLIVVTILVSGGFYVARQESRIALAVDRSKGAFYLAEAGVAAVLTNWQADAYSALSPWDSTTVSGTENGGTWSVKLTRMDRLLYFLESRSTLAQGDGVYGRASRSIGLIAKLNSLAIDPPAALTTVGDLTIGGSSQVDGNDAEPGEWGEVCDPVGPAKPGIMIDSLSNITTEGKSHVVGGDPPTTEDNTLTSESLLTFGDQTWDDLVALANLVFHPGTHVTQTYADSTFADGSWYCTTSDKLNWGDPYHPGGACGSYFPVIHAQGNFLVDASDYGQGIMLVEGDLTVKGGFEFYGPVIVRGSLITEGTGGHFNGAVIAANVKLSSSSVLGAALVQYSSCSVERAILNSSLTRVRALAQRSWVDLSSLRGY